MNFLKKKNHAKTPGGAVFEETAEGVTIRIPEGVPEGIAEGILEEIPRGISEEIPGGISERTVPGFLLFFLFLFLSRRSAKKCNFL